MANAQLDQVVMVSEGLVRAAGTCATPAMGAAALALALGRLCGSLGLDLDRTVSLARIAHDEADPSRALSQWEAQHPA